MRHFGNTKYGVLSVAHKTKKNKKQKERLLNKAARIFGCSSLGQVEDCELYLSFHLDGIGHKKAVQEVKSWPRFFY